MSSIHYDFPNLQRGDEIIVTLKGVESNVLLLDPSNLSAFKAGRSYRYGGGLVKRSPFRLVVPSDGHWHVVVQPIGGKVSASAEVRRAPARLPTAVSAPAHSNRPAQAHTITDVGRNLAMIHEDDTDPGIDVFISHASEDKAEVARPLHDLLVGRGLNVWLDEVDSTNAEARRRAEAGETGPLWITAARQTQGRGRRGRRWETPRGNLAATLLSNPVIEDYSLSVEDAG